MPRKRKHVLTLRQALQKLVRLSGKQRLYALRHVDDSFIRQLAAAVKAARYRPVSNQVRVKLGRHRKALRTIANPRAGLQSKRKALMRQNGGAVGPILAMLGKYLPVIAPIAAGAASYLWNMNKRK